MRKQRFLYLSDSAGHYGGENALAELISLLAPRHDVTLVVPGEGPLAETCRAMGARIVITPVPTLDRRYLHPLRIFNYGFLAAASIARLVSVYRSLSPDLVHTNNVLTIPGAVAARIVGIPHIWHIREIVAGHHIHPMLWKLWRWFILAFSSRVICISAAVAEQFGGDPKAVVVHDGIDTTLFRPHLPKRKQRDVVVGMVGRLEHRRKGQDTFIELAKRALEVRKDLRFVIVGHERENISKREEQLYTKVRSTGLESRVEFRGRVPRAQIPDVMNELDILVLCSKQPEGLGLVLLEAMSCGKAVISFAEGGPLDIVKDGENGVLVPPQDVEQLAQKVLLLASEQKLRARLGAAGRATVVDRFRSDSMTQKIETIYNEIAARRERRRPIRQY